MLAYARGHLRLCGLAALVVRPGRHRQGTGDEARCRHGTWHGDAARLRRRGRRGSVCSRARAAPAESRNSRSPICRRRSPARFRAATAPTAPTIPTSGWSRRSSARSTSSSSMRCARRRQALERFRLEADDLRRPDRDRRDDRLRHRRHRGHRRDRDHAEGARDRAASRRSSFPGRLINLASGYVSIEHGLKGPNHAVVDRLLDRRARDRRCGAADRARRCRRDGGGRHRIADQPASSMAGFAACRALSTGFNDTPTKASRPYDKDRDGFVMGEGAGVVVLEEYEHAKARGAKIYAELVGYGLSGDAYHITAPSEDGDGAFRCMNAALKRAGISPAEIDYINAHGTSTMADDDRARRGRARGRQCGRQDLDVVDQVLHRAPARRGRRGRGDLLDSRDARSASRRRPSISTIRRSRRRSIWCRTRRASATSTWCCRIRSASAAPTRRWSSAARRA